MFDRIESGKYWDRALSLVEGCSPVSAGCQHCWAAQQTYVRSHQTNKKIRTRYEGLSKDKTTFNGNIRLMHENLDLPPRTRKPTVWAVWNDLFHNDVPTEFIDSVWSRMARCPQHIFIILTRRPKRMAEFVDNCGVFNYGVLPNIWPGVSVEDQETADERIPILLQVPAAKRVVSYEPGLGPVDLHKSVRCGYYLDERGGVYFRNLDGIDWVICGGETGPGARPMNPEWARQVRRQCAEAGVPYFLKQNGMWRPLEFGRVKQGSLSSIYGIMSEKVHWFNYDDGTCEGVKKVTKKQAGRLLDGREYNEIPEGR